MSWTPGLDLESLRYGQRKRGTGLLKRRLAERLVRKGTPKEAADRRLVRWLFPRSLYFNRATKTAVMVFQKRQRLKVDGVVGRSTWLALGFKESDLMPLQLRGIPYPGGGVRPMDGNWVAIPLWNAVAKVRKAGLWNGGLNSGWRPDWYQKLLWDAAVARYGSEQAASKWVARPGTSKHRFSNELGAVDVNDGDTLDAQKAKTGLFRPMSWEEWHFQLSAPYGGKLLGFGGKAGSIPPIRGKDDEARDAELAADEQRDSAEMPPGVDMDMINGFIENELENCEQDRGVE